MQVCKYAGMHYAWMQEHVLKHQIRKGAVAFGHSGDEIVVRRHIP